MLQSMKLKKRPRRSFRNPLALRTGRNLPKTLRTPPSRNTKPTSPVKGWRRFWPFRRKRRFVFTWKKFFLWFGLCFLVFIIGVAGVFAYYIRDLPNPKELETRKVDQSTNLVDRNGKTLYSIHGEENRIIVPSDQINDYVKKATVAVEDGSFYTNPGVDIRGILRAVRNRFTHQGLTGSGSTITQQFIKNALLTRDQTIDRKLKELILALEIGKTYSKEDILTGYLNQISYGNSAYGIETASETYFNKHSKDLTLSESATLAAIPNIPTYYSPYGTHLSDLFIRKDYILDRMVTLGFITDAQAADAKKAAPTVENPNFQAQKGLVAPHFVFYVREQLLQLSKQYPELNLDDAHIDTEGYTIVTSLDLDTQNMAQQIMTDMGPGVVKKYQATNAALTAVDPRTGEVLAMVGSIDYSNSISGNTNFATARLQPGSSFKPIVYSTAFGPDYKYSPSSVVYDVKTDFGNYTPNNYNGNFNGPVTDRQALAGSLNIPAVKNLYLVGIDKAIVQAQKLGITTLDRPINEYGLSLVLGAGEVEPVEMAGAYSTFANGGMRNPLRPILRIEKNGKVVKDFTTTPAVEGVKPETAYEINNILSDNSARSFIFGANSALTLKDRPVAAKSGTTDNNRDAWTIGYTPSIAVAVWVGNNAPNKTMVKGADGSFVAAPIWNRFMKQYLTGKPVEQFTRPSDIVDITVDKLSGKLPTDQSPPDQHITDIFAPWQVPKDPDNVHQKVKIDKLTGKLATDLTPAEDAIDQIYTTIHSEAPDKPNWEQPVQDWAKANNFVPAPTDKDDLHVDANRPSITFISPVNGATVAGSVAIELSVSGGTRTIGHVDLVLDGASLTTLTAAPWTYSFDSSALSPGSHILQATVTNDIGLTKSDQVTINAGKDTTPPGSVINPSATDGNKILNTPIHLTWTNPGDGDLASVNIYESTSNDPSDLGVKIRNVAALPNATVTESIDVSTLTLGKIYYFIIRPVDTQGNENLSTLKLSAVVH